MASQAVLELIVNLQDNASKGLGGLGGALKTIGGVAGGAALAGVVALGAGIVSGVGDAKEAAIIFAQTEAVIRSTGGAAGVTAQQVAEYSSALSDASGASLFGDDQIAQSTNLLLTFTEIKGKTLEAATAISVDMAQAMGGAPKDAAIQLGKALNDPIAGITALSRVGVSFTDEQKAQIKTMQEAGDMAGAQAVILGELNKEFGGSAKAAAEADGGMAQFNASIGEAFESIGTALLPVLNQFAAWLNKPEVQEGIKIFAEKLAKGIVIAADFLTNKLIPAVVALYNFLAPILGPIIAEIARALGEDLPRGVERVTATWNEMQRMMGDFKNNYIDPIVRGWEAISRAISDANEWFKRVGDSVSRITIPGWLQGHSPPPMANWFSDIAGAADSASNAVSGVAPGDGALPSSVASLGASGGATTITVGSIIVQGSSDIQKTAIAVRDELIRISNRNVTSGVV